MSWKSWGLIKLTETIRQVKEAAQADYDRWEKLRDKATSQKNRETCEDIMSLISYRLTHGTYTPGESDRVYAKAKQCIEGE